MGEKSKLVPFAFGDNLVRVIEDENGEPWFVAKDVALALEYSDATISNIGKTISHVPHEWQGRDRIPTPSGEQEMLTLSEQGLYFFLGRSDKPKALPFQKWLVGEVVPSIRKTGRYVSHTARPKAAPIPTTLPPEVIALRPAMREKLWRNALRTAYLDGGTSATAWHHFLTLCRMVSVEPPKPIDAREKVKAFFNGCCEYDAGSTGDVPEFYEAFRRWHRTQDGNLPSKKLFVVHMRDYARYYRSNGSRFEGLRLK